VNKKPLSKCCNALAFPDLSKDKIEYLHVIGDSYQPSAVLVHPYICSKCGKECEVRWVREKKDE